MRRRKGGVRASPWAGLFLFNCQRAACTTMRIPAARCARALPSMTLTKMEGAGNAGCLAAPIASRGNRENHASFSHHRYAVCTGIPCAMVYDLFRALPGVRDLLVTVVRGIITRALSASPGAPGPHDFAVRVARCSSGCANRVHRIPPHVRDDAYAPLIGAGRCSLARFLIFGKRKFDLRAKQAETN